MPSELEVQMMSRAIELAKRGRGHVEPNPMVGCVIVKDGRIIGEGFHQKFGGPHAEPNALASCTENPAGATAVVTLEPCCHTNKKTPPCVPALLDAGIRRVIIGSIDPNPNVCGDGIAQLRAAGVEVLSGVSREQCDHLNAPFHALTRFGRPYVTLKWAESADGLLGGTGNTPRKISGREGWLLVHSLRTRSDAICVSADTVLSDDPQLTVRVVEPIRTPIRVVLDSHLRIPETCRLVRTAAEVPVHVFTLRQDTPKWPGVVFHVSPAVGGHVDLRFLLQKLGEMQCTHLLVEPGPRLACAWMESGLFDRLWVIRSTTSLGETGAPMAPPVRLVTTGQRFLTGDVVNEHLNPESPVFVSQQPSCDLSLPTLG